MLYVSCNAPRLRRPPGLNGLVRSRCLVIEAISRKPCHNPLESAAWREPPGTIYQSTVKASPLLLPRRGALPLGTWHWQAMYPVKGRSPGIIAKIRAIAQIYVEITTQIEKDVETKWRSVPTLLAWNGIG